MSWNIEHKTSIIMLRKIINFYIINIIIKPTVIILYNLRQSGKRPTQCYIIFRYNINLIFFNFYWIIFFQIKQIRYCFIFNGYINVFNIIRLLLYSLYWKYYFIIVLIKRLYCFIIHWLLIKLQFIIYRICSITIKYNLFWFRCNI